MRKLKLLFACLFIALFLFFCSCDFSRRIKPAMKPIGKTDKSPRIMENYRDNKKNDNLEVFRRKLIEKRKRDSRKFNKKLKNLDKEIEKTPKNASSYYKRGKFYYDNKKYEPAIKDFSRAIHLNPQYVDAYHYRGTSYLKSGSIHKALKNLNKALEIDPKYSKSYHTRNVCYYELKKFNKALNDLERSKNCGRIKEKDFYFYYYTSRACIFYRQKEYRKAIEDNLRGSKFKKDDPRPYTNLAGIYLLNIRNNSKARECLDLALKRDPFNATAYSLYGLYYAIVSDPEKAILNFDKAILIDPDERRAHRNKGDVLLKIGITKKAIECFNKYMELEKSDPVAYYLRGFAYKKENDFDSARKDFMMSIKFDPDGKVGKESKKELEKMRGNK
ncbi:MAG: tetratricopeptide repeat protein [Candidatus Eremiobacteraeota bacterium]|nr:tetratricopeptide repeat protein [Candidatus Eremiobacteraeota bacterium]